MPSFRALRAYRLSLTQFKKSYNRGLRSASKAHIKNPKPVYQKIPIIQLDPIPAVPDAHVYHNIHIRQAATTIQPENGEALDSFKRVLRFAPSTPTFRARHVYKSGSTTKARRLSLNQPPIQHFDSSHLLLRQLETYFPKTARDVFLAPASSSVEYTISRPSEPVKKYAGSPTSPLSKYYDEITQDELDEAVRLTDQRISKPSITAKFFQYLNHSTTDPLTPQEVQYLASEGYNPHDAKVWAQILSKEKLRDAIDLLHQTVTRNPHFPLFVIVFLAKRRSFTSQSLQRFLYIACTILHHGAHNVASADRQIFLLFTRLHRHAKDIWPPGLVPITSLITTFMPAQYLASAKTWSEDARVTMAAMYNRALMLLSQSSKARPYLSYWFKEQAQFVILTKMAQSDIPLDLTPMGYLGLVKVQLASRHTDQERDWLNLQSRAVPPFPEPKNAFDEQKHWHYAQSRAMKTIQHMKAAGFSVSEWEQVAKHYAGWEVDGTPTIQSRSMLPNHNLIQQNPISALWASRINAARDIREAWAAFLRFEASGDPANPWIYFAMFKKIVSEADRVLEKNPYATVVVGNVKELLPPAASPLQKIYLESEPPTYMAFFHKMIQAQVLPQQSFFGYLIGHAPSIQDGLTIWYQFAGPKSDIVKSALLTPSHDPMSQAAFSGLIELLSRFPLSHGIINHLAPDLRYNLRTVAKGLVQDQQRLNFMRNFHETSIFQAYCLLLWRKHTNVKSWTDLIHGISWVSVHGNMWPEAYNFIDFVNGIIKSMQDSNIEFAPEFFMRACQFLEVAGRNARSLTAWTPEGESARLRIKLAKTTLQTGGQTLRTLFTSLTSSHIPDHLVQTAAAKFGINPIPTTFHVFTSYDCLRYIRALATFGDHDGVLEFVRWVVRNEQWLAPIFSNEEGGRRRWNSILSMIHLALAAPSTMHDHVSEAQLPRAPQPVVELVDEELKKLQTLESGVKFEVIRNYLRALDKEWLGEKIWNREKKRTRHESTEPDNLNDEKVHKEQEEARRMAG